MRRLYTKFGRNLGTWFENPMPKKIGALSAAWNTKTGGCFCPHRLTKNRELVEAIIWMLSEFQNRVTAIDSLAVFHA